MEIQPVAIDQSIAPLARLSIEQGVMRKRHVKGPPNGLPNWKPEHVAEVVASREELPHSVTPTDASLRAPRKCIRWRTASNYIEEAANVPKGCPREPEKSP